MSIGGHQSHKMMKDEWLTPPEILEALGPFDLDPCSPIDRPWPTAEQHYTVLDNGLKKPWRGRVWCNPPYGEQTGIWLARCADHGDTIALVFARTETRMFFEHVWPKASAVLFLEGRLHFHHVCGRRARANSGGPSVLIAYGEQNAEVLKRCKLAGRFIAL
ncbi:MAG: adenine methyltransferase [Deltaproteobacteria bacterium]|nr:MAG: adenine methyltransferase [Deltaproteobacteria bacterium]